MSSTSALVLTSLPDELALDAHREVQRGTTASYSIVLTNTGENTMALVDDDCPLYRQSMGSTESRPLLLDCGGPDGLLIAPDTSVRFEMRLTVPIDLPLGMTTLRWQFVEPESRALSSPVVVVDRTDASAP